MKNTNGWKISESKLQAMRDESTEIAIEMVGLEGRGGMHPVNGTKGLRSFIQDYLDVSKETRGLDFMVIETPHFINEDESIYRIAYKDNEYYGIKD